MDELSRPWVVISLMYNRDTHTLEQAQMGGTIVPLRISGHIGYCLREMERHFPVIFERYDEVVIITRGSNDV